MTHSVSRRTMLRGVGAAVALPWLESLLPRRPLLAAGGATAAAAKPPLRTAFLCYPNGMVMADWTPSYEGALQELPKTLEPLDPFKKKILVLTGLTHDKARSNGDGAGDHARSSACFLTACQARKTAGADIKAGISVDQIAANEIGKATRLPSLEIGCDPAMNAGSCDSGYSCAYSANISWKSESLPMAKEVNPKLVFERLFGDGPTDADDARRREREALRKSILDYVADDARRLNDRLASTDRRKMDEYFTSVRELERRIALAEAQSHEQKADVPDYPAPAGIPQNYAEHIRLLNDLTALAFQSDVTRIATFLVANEGSNRSYPDVGVSDGHHSISHHGKEAKKLDGLRKINRFHMEQFAHLLGKLDGMKEADGTLLDHSLIVVGSSISDGDRHNHDDLPVLLCGGGNGTVASGRHVRYAKDTPLANLFLSMLDRLGVAADHVGDSTGRLEKLEA